MNLSKRTILIGISTLAVVGAGLTYYFLTKDNADVLGWKDSNWLYRKSISVANSGSTLTNEDVLIELDTATMISAGKLLTTCADLRFTDSDDSTYLQYWVEGGCNTATTQVWVRIPSLTAGGKTIYMYYGNNAAATAEQSWSGKFILMKNAACDSGWTTESNSGGSFYQRFPYPAATYGGTGGASGYSHATLTMATSTNSAGGVSVSTAAGSTIPQTTHTHNNVSFVIPSVTALPAYLDMIVCSNTKLIVKQNTVSYFATTVPSGFTQFSALNSKFPRGNSSYGGTSTTTTHTHTVTAVTTSSISATMTCPAGGQTAPSGAHTHTFAAFTTGSGTQTPSYKTAIYGLASSDIKAPSGIIEMTDVVPPLGWTQYTGLNGYFPLGSATFGTTGGSATHTHSISARTSSGYSGSTTCTLLTPTQVPLTHTHTTSATTSGTASNLPPYINVMLIQKKTSQTITLNAEELQNVAPNAPTNLLTEGATNPTGVGDTTPEFSAIFSDPDAADSGSYYQIQVNTNSSFTGTTMWDSTQTALSPNVSNGSRSQDISYAGSTLQLATTYYWRIKFWDNSSKGILSSSWSATAQFTMNAVPTAPTGLYCQGQTNPIKVTTTTPTFSAIFNDPDSSDTGTSYQIIVTSVSTGDTMWSLTKTSLTTPVANGVRSEDITYAGTALVPGELYYWRIGFWDNYDNEGLWSSVAQFRLQGVYLPSLLLTNGTTAPDLVLTNPYFSAVFSDPNGDSSSAYQIVVNTNPTFTGTTMWDSGKTAISLASGDQSPNIQYAGSVFPRPKITYYWHIKFWDSDDYASGWSDYAQFTYTTNSFMFEGLGASGINIH
jgi:hypothetical protein